MPLGPDMLPSSALAVPRRSFGQGPILACLCPCHCARLQFQTACFVWSQVGTLHQSSCCASASVARVPVGLMLVGAHYQPHLLVAQVIFVTAGTNHGFPIIRAALHLLLVLLGQLVCHL